MITAHRNPGFLRVAILMAALFAMLGVSMASTSAAHIHARSSGSQCDICLTAHVVSLEAHTVFHQFGPASDYDELRPRAVSVGYHLLLASSSSSRGPPALFP